MTLLAASFEVDLAPGSAIGLASTLFLLFLAAYVVVRGTVAVGDKLTPLIWPTMAFFGIALLAIAYSSARDDGNDVVRVSVEADRLAVEPGRSDSGSQLPQGGQSGSDGDTFRHSLPFEHSHDGGADHSHP